MSWLESRLQPIDLLSALQLKMRGGQGGMQDGVQSGKLKAIQEQLAEQQLKSAQEANKMAELRRSMLTPTGMPGATNDPYFQGYENYAKAQETDKLLSLMNGGKAYTGIGDFGTGSQGGGGYGRGGDENLSYADKMKKQQAEQSAHQLALNEGFNPTQPKPDTMAAANALGNLYRPGGQDVPQTPMTPQQLLAQEQSNTAGYQSLLNQKGGIAPQTNANMMAGTTPVQDAINSSVTEGNGEIQAGKEAYLVGGPRPKGLSNQETLALEQEKNKIATQKKDAEKRISGRQKETETIQKYEAALYKDPHWTAKEKDGGIKAKEKEDVKQKYLAYVRWTISKGEVPDPESFWGRIFKTE